MKPKNYSLFLKQVDEIFANKVKSKLSLDKNGYRELIKKQSAYLDIDSFDIYKGHTLEEFFTKYQKYLKHNIIAFSSDELWLMNKNCKYWEIKNDSDSLYFEVPSKISKYMYPYGYIGTASIIFAGVVALLFLLITPPTVDEKKHGPIIPPEPVYKHWYEHTESEFWWRFCSDGSEFQATEEDIGRTVKLSLTQINTENVKEYEVRLIDIEHDELSNGSGKAHCTFEFVNLFSDFNNDELFCTDWDGNGSVANNCNYPNSELHKQRIKYTNSGGRSGHVYNLPSDIYYFIKDVTKTVGYSTSPNNTFTTTTFDNKFFPLSYYELEETADQYAVQGEGSIYEYYKGKTASDRIKKAIDGTPANYWLRSPYTSSYTHAWFVDSNGSMTHDHVNCDYGSTSNIGIAACFCI